MQFEVSIRRDEDVERAADIIKKFKIRSVQVTHVTKERSPVLDAGNLVKLSPGVDIGVNLSMKHCSGTNFDESHHRLRGVMEECGKYGIKRALVVSGHPREKFDTLDALQFIHSQGLAHDMDICCAYNPFFDPARLRDEHARLEQKLSYSFVHSVAIQIGVDTEKLKKGVKVIRSLKPDIAIFGELPIPTKAMLAYLQKNPLYGVFLPISYLANEKTAEEVTKEVLRVYEDLEITPIGFSLNFDETEVETALALEK